MALYSQKKNPRAVMEKLAAIEEKVMTRIANNDFKCGSSLID